MDILNAMDKEEKKIETFPYRGKPLKVKEVGIRWLSQAGPEDSPEYGLRFFAVGPGGEIPIHNHFYVQTMYMLSGHLVAFSHDPETDEVTEERTVGPNDVIFVPSMEPHSMKNMSDSESATFLCCIANVYEEDVP
ncbi:MAG: cupin domain-containing protein [Desulfobacteraceae bacterium]|jgi:quercetin dioxygenase-like cupin family protein